MSKITINGFKVYSKNIPNIQSVSFDYLGHKVYSAEKLQRMFGVFVSQPVIGEGGLVGWKEAILSLQKPAGTDVFLYIKSAYSADALALSPWVGPYLNAVNLN